MRLGITRSPTAPKPFPPAPLPIMTTIQDRPPIIQMGGYSYQRMRDGSLRQIGEHVTAGIRKIACEETDVQLRHNTFTTGFVGDFGDRTGDYIHVDLSLKEKDTKGVKFSSAEAQKVTEDIERGFNRRVAQKQQQIAARLVSNGMDRESAMREAHERAIAEVNWEQSKQ